VRLPASLVTALAALLLFGARLSPAVVLASCSCGEQGVKVNVSPVTAARVTDFRVSGPGCKDRDVVCVASLPAGCLTFHVQAKAEGSCTIEIDFDGAETFMETVRIEESGGCYCPGFYADPYTDFLITVPEV
jgi:hypothetical protein